MTASCYIIFFVGSRYRQALFSMQSRLSGTFLFSFGAIRCVSSKGTTLFSTAYLDLTAWLNKPKPERDFDPGRWCSCLCTLPGTCLSQYARRCHVGCFAKSSQFGCCCVLEIDEFHFVDRHSFKSWFACIYPWFNDEHSATLEQEAAGKLKLLAISNKKRKRGV